MRLGALLPLLLALAVPAWAGVERWTPYGPPPGSLVTLAVDGDRLYAATDKSGVVASDDRGLTWFRSSVGMGDERVEAIVLDSDDHVLYAAGQHRFFQSVDAGAHWTVLGQLPAQEPPGLGEEPVHDVLALSPGEPDTFFLSIGKVLYRSTDGGRSWASVLTRTGAILSVLVDPNDPRSVFVGTWEESESTLLHSPDAGATWAQVTNVHPAGPPPDTPPFSHGVLEITAAATTPTTLFALSGNSGSNLYRSVDAGATWREIQLPPPGDGVTVSVVSVVATPGRHPRIYAFQDDFTGNSFSEIALFASDDLGDTWALSTKAARGTSLRVDPATGALFSFNASGVGIAMEEGRPWRFSPLGISCNLDSYFEPRPKVRFARGRTYAIVGGRLWESRDGQSWSALALDLADRCIDIRDVTVDRRPGVLWAAAVNGFYRSNDGGATWKVSLPGGWYGLRDYRIVTQLDAHTILVSGNGLWRSGDRGVTWKKTLSRFVLYDQFNDPDFERSVYRVRVEPGNPKIVYAEAVEYGERHPPLSFQHVYQSLDGGLTWRRLVSGVAHLAIDPTRPETVYGIRGGELLRSSDRGRHWKKISDYHPSPSWDDSDLVVDPHDPRVLYSAGGGVWRSLDRGITWAPLSTGVGGLQVFEIFPDPRRPGRLFAASREGLFTGSFALPGEDGAQSVYDRKAYEVVCAHPGGASWASRLSVSGFLQH